MADEPAVSVLMCVRDGERYLGDAIESALGQSLPPREVVVVDDGSSDGTAAVARSFGGQVRLIAQEPLGLGAARNTALAAATGELAGYLDADDLWEPHRLEAQAAAFERDPSLDLVFGHMRRFRDGSAELSEPVAAPFGGTLLFRRAAARRVGPFPTHVRTGEFLDWILRARHLGLRETTLPDVVALRRVHGENMTRRELAPFGDYARLLKASIDRRRAS